MPRDTGEERIRGLERQLAEANEQIEAVARSVAQDLRAPLKHIGGFAALLVSRAENGVPAESRRWLEIIQQSTRRMGELVDELLDFTRVARAPIGLAQLNLTVIVQSAWDSVRQDAAEREVAWSVGALPDALGDHDLLLVAFRAMLHHALRATRGFRHTEIAVDGRRRGAEVIITVRDNGPELEGAGERSLDAAHRRHSSDQFESSGIGLLIVQRVVQRHGGRTWAETPAEGGALFGIALPAAPERQ